MKAQLAPKSYWIVRHIKDEVLNVNGGRLNIDLLHRVLRARRVTDYHRTTGTTPRLSFATTEAATR